VPLAPEVRRGLDSHLVLYFTGSTRQARSILQEQRLRSASGDSRTIEALHALKAQVAPMREALQAGDFTWIGALLHEAWQMKRRVSSGISNGAIDAAYEAARSAGALGGKITGAGGGGFLLLYCPSGRQRSVRVAMARLGLPEFTFDFDYGGAQVLSDLPAGAGRLAMLVNGT
jgi:D-glycero-alpha-D-manno-heptose-7-phosphate kinase